MPLSSAARMALASVLLLPAVLLMAQPALAAPLTLALPAPLPPVRLLTVLVGLHVLGVCFGLGGATMLDFWILRWLRWGDLPGEVARIFGFVSKVCTVGLALLWLSGLGFLALYAVETPEKLANPKLWAKLTVVLVLSLNGLVIAFAVLPNVLRNVGQPILQGLSAPRAALFLVSGAVSGVSWYTAFGLGLMRELNGTVAYEVLIGFWLGGIGVTALGAFLLWRHLRGRTGFRTARQALADEVAASGRS